MRYKTFKFRVNKDELIRNESFTINARKVNTIAIYHDVEPYYKAGTASISIDQKNVIENKVVFNDISYFSTKKMLKVTDAESPLKSINVSLNVNYTGYKNYFNVYIIVGYD